MLVAEHESVQTDDVLSKSAAVLWMSDLCCLRSAHCLISADTFITRIDQALTKAEVEEFPGSGPSRAKCKPKSICSVCLVIPHQISGGSGLSQPLMEIKGQLRRRLKLSSESKVRWPCPPGAGPGAGPAWEQARPGSDTMHHILFGSCPVLKY